MNWTISFPWFIRIIFGYLYIVQNQVNRVNVRDPIQPDIFTMPVNEERFNIKRRHLIRKLQFQTIWLQEEIHNPHNRNSFLISP